MSTRLLCLVVVAAAACAGTRGGTGPQSPSQGKRGIAAAGLPYQVLDERTGHQVAEAAFWETLATQRAVCVGEEHPNPHHHWVQLEVVRHLAKVWPHLALGMEMFQVPFQGVLDDYAAKRIDAATLRARSGYEDRWGYDFGFYGPTIDATVEAHGALLALNAAKELTKKVVHHGLEGLTTDERAHVPELVLDDARHRSWFDALMEDMGGSTAHSQKAEGDDDKEPAMPKDATHAAAAAAAAEEMPSADRVYTVQVIWDETMADTSAKWLAEHPDGRLVILAGSGHCHDSAIVDRIKRRGIKDVVSLRTVIDDGEGGVAEALAKPMNDYLFVLELPADVKARMKAQTQ